MTGLKVLKSVNNYVIKMTDATGFPGEMLQILPDVGLQQTKEQQKMMTQDVIRVQPDQKAVQVQINFKCINFSFKQLFRKRYSEIYIKLDCSFEFINSFWVQR